LRQLSNEEAGEFVAILDADFVPQPEFLSRALAWFRDEEVGCVQTPQHFFNPDPLPAWLWCGEQMARRTAFFFDVLLASKDAWGVAFCLRALPRDASGGSAAGRRLSDRKRYGRYAAVA
jgi:cellulose synthase (UDP-forming)